MNPRSPLTPDQAKAQVERAARDLTEALKIEVLAAWVGLDSCNDQGESPFRGRAAIHFPASESRAQAQAETARFMGQLQGAGWFCHPPTEGMAQRAEKNCVTAIFEEQSNGDRVRVITLLGECRDITTTRDNRGSMTEILNL